MLFDRVIGVAIHIQALKRPHFLEAFLALQGGDYAVACVNGTITMEVALRAAGIGWGDEVIVPAYTFQATGAAPMAAGCIPIIVDIDPTTYCIDPKAAEAAITDKTKAIIPVHIGASMADMDAIMALAEKYNLVVIEDCAHAHGAKWNGQGAGTIGHFGSFSLQTTKTITSGEGGVLICQTAEFAQKAASIINCGRSHALGGGEETGENFHMGANYRMSELHSALARVGVERFPEQAKQREEMAIYMDEALSEIPGIRVFPHDPRHTPRSFYRYIFAIDPEIFGFDHKVVCAALEAEGIGCWIGYEPMHHYELFQPHLSKLPVPMAYPERFDFASMNFSVAEYAWEQEAVWLGEEVFRAGPKGVDDVVAGMQKIYDNRAALTP